MSHLFPIFKGMILFEAGLGIGLIPVLTSSFLHPAIKNVITTIRLMIPGIFVFIFVLTINCKDIFNSRFAYFRLNAMGNSYSKLPIKKKWVNEILIQLFSFCQSKVIT